MPSKVKNVNVRINLIGDTELRRNLKLVALHMGTTANELGIRILREGVHKQAQSAGIELL